MVIGVDGFLAAHFAAEDLDGAVGDDFVGVHVGLRAGAGLEDGEGELLDELQVGYFFRCLLYSSADFGIEAIFHVYCCCSSFQDPECSDHTLRHPFLREVDVEVSQGPLRLRSPVLVRFDLDGPEGVGFCACAGHSDGLIC